MGSTNVSPKLRALQPLQLAILLLCVLAAFGRRGMGRILPLEDTQGNRLSAVWRRAWAEW